MSDNRLMIVPCEYQDFPCSSFVCNEISSAKKFYVGNPYSGGLHNYPVFCEHCISHLVSNLSADLAPTGAEIKTKIKEQLTEEYNALLAEKVAKVEKAAIVAAEILVAMKLAEAQSVFGNAPEEEIVAEETQDKKVFRCLDCGAEDFDNKEALDAHKATHEEPKNKGGRPKKAQS